MQHVEAADLQDVPKRIKYVKAFLNFTVDDGKMIQAAAPLIAPLLPAVLDAVYGKLLSFDITAKAFVPRQPELEGADAPATPQELSLTHPHILHRKDFLKNYLVKLVSNEDWSDSSPFWPYLDKVGVMHTGEPGFKHREKRPELRVEYMHMGLLLGFVEDVVAGAILGAEELDLATKAAAIKAFNKLLWIQNDLFARHYVVEKDTK